MLEKGYIYLHRNILNWRWFKDSNTFRVFIYLLLQANYDPCDFEMITVERGQLVTSYSQIANILDITERQVRTAIQHLKMTGEVSVKQMPKYSVVTLINYNLYQSGVSQEVRQTSGKSQAKVSQTSVRSQADVSNERKLKKQESNNIIPPLPPTGEKSTNEFQNQDQGESLKVKTAGGNTNHSTTLDEDFDTFWEVYPKKADKQKALKAWQKLKPDKETLNAILAAVERHKQSDKQWQRDDGQYIPYPSTFLNGRRWEDKDKVDLTAKHNDTYDYDDFDPDDPFKDWR